jgi:BirA family biotin operon repressor/biotin-[acetyl-CoA-carboxylase] ligase
VNEGAARVLEALRRAPQGPQSGTGLSHRLGVSRAQIWKHVESLRGLGYTIEGEAGGGYRLRGAPDRLYAAEIQAGLTTAWLAQELHHRESTDSTNRVAAELARAGARHGATVVAEAQTAGRGRLGRSFFSPAHLNLYTSSVLRPPLSTAEAPSAVLAAAVAVAETVAGAVDDPDAVEIKWPNDVLLGGLKTSGILMELSAEAARVAWLVLGIGVNLNVERESFPPEFRALATSLACHRGRPVERVAFARALYGTLEEVLDLHAEKGLDALRPRFDAFFRMRGRHVRVQQAGAPECEGRVEGIDGDGALLLRSEQGVRRILAGDVTLAKPVAAP